jgi:hypothetical protein
MHTKYNFLAYKRFGGKVTHWRIAVGAHADLTVNIMCMNFT